MTPACQLRGLILLTSLLFTIIAATEFTNSFANLSYGSTIQLTWDASSIPPEAYPLFITAQLIDKGDQNDNGNGNGNGGGGGAVTAYKMNITTSIGSSSSSSSTNTFEWTGIPSPLRWVPEGEGLYQVELHRSGPSDDGAGTALLAKSPFFAVAQPPYASGTEEEPSTSSSGDEVSFVSFLFALTSVMAHFEEGIVLTEKDSAEQPTPSDDDSGDEGGSGANKRLAYGVGFAVGIPSVVGLSLVSWCLWKRRRRVLDEKSEEERRARRRDFVID
ncbi:hypothetical protein B0T20DRAFT_466247 [Sordaria brevicollis]|uniref:Uncharacterized protein n=1 Tax=Sordaria brevicollis TaxID=83679 RepID=A0AAE0PNY8_SORBR|nr:hypothetical protein B0T20DRAFT_466247 [Sordaria brevicollis]